MTSMSSISDMRVTVFKPANVVSTKPKIDNDDLPAHVLNCAIDYKHGGSPTLLDYVQKHLPSHHDKYFKSMLQDHLESFTKNEHVIDFEIMWKEVGFTEKFNAVRLLKQLDQLSTGTTQDTVELYNGGDSDKNVQFYQSVVAEVDGNCGVSESETRYYLNYYGAWMFSLQAQTTQAVAVRQFLVDLLMICNEYLLLQVAINNTQIRRIPLSDALCRDVLPEFIRPPLQSHDRGMAVRNHLSQFLSDTFEFDLDKSLNHYIGYERFFALYQKWRSVYLEKRFKFGTKERYVAFNHASELLRCITLFDDRVEIGYREDDPKETVLYNIVPKNTKLSWGKKVKLDSFTSWEMQAVPNSNIPEVIVQEADQYQHEEVPSLNDYVLKHLPASFHPMFSSMINGQCVALSSTVDYVVEFNRLWQILGFSLKKNAVNALRNMLSKHLEFTKTQDTSHLLDDSNASVNNELVENVNHRQNELYKEIPWSECDHEVRRRGRRSADYHLTYRGALMFCMEAQTNNAMIVRWFFVQLLRIYNNYILLQLAIENLRADHSLNKYALHGNLVPYHIRPCKMDHEMALRIQDQIERFVKQACTVDYDKKRRYWTKPENLFVLYFSWFGSETYNFFNNKGKVFDKKNEEISYIESHNDMLTFATLFPKSVEVGIKEDEPDTIYFFNIKPREGVTFKKTKRITRKSMH